MQSVANTRPALHPIIWAAAVAVIAVSAVGIAAMTGIIPGHDKAAEPSTAVVPAAAAVAPPTSEVASQPIAPAAPAAPARLAEPKPTKRSTHTHKDKAQQIVVPPATDNRAANAPPPPQYAPPPPICHECGVVESVRTITQEGQGSGVGAVAGGVLGGALGHGVGQGTGRDLATIAGVVGGAMLGNKVEKTQRTKTIYETTVKFDNGTSRVFTSETSPPWRAGEKVLQVGGVLQYR